MTPISSAVGGKALALPRERFLGEPWDRYKSNELRIQATVDHALDENWSLRTLARFSDTNTMIEDTYPRGLATDGRTLNRRYFNFGQDFQNYALQANLTGEIETGPFEHSFLFGVDSNFTRFKSSGFDAALDPIDIFNPVYGAALGQRSATNMQDRRIDFYGLYLQDMISFGAHWKLLLGGRYDMVKTQFDLRGRRLSDKRDRAFSPRAGLVYQPIEDLSLYASYTTSFSAASLGRGLRRQALQARGGRAVRVRRQARLVWGTAFNHAGRLPVDTLQSFDP